MKPLSLLPAVAGLACASLAGAQTNNDDDTPLGSRIARDRQILRDLADTFAPGRIESINRKRRGSQLNHFASCMFDRSHEMALSLIERTDYGFNNPAQIGTTVEALANNHGFQDCMNRVARNSQRATRLAMNAGNVRAMLLKQAYFDRYPDRPTWIRAGYASGDRVYPLSGSNPGILAAMDFADCVVAADPVKSDYLFRTPEGSDEETDAIAAVTPSLGPCLGEGNTISLTPGSLRIVLGEALWHAANHSAPAPAETQQETAP